MTGPQRHLVVVGAGVAGLGTALAAARAGHRVTIVERDATPMPESADTAFAWDRTGAPQVRHSHAFLARLRNLLAERAPDVLDALLDAGATELRFTDNLPPTLSDLEPRPGDEGLVALACRRTTFEWVLRRSVLATPGVEFLDGVAVEGLIAERSCAAEAPRVTELVARRVADGVTFERAADAVIDASGPRSASAKWLGGIGVAEPPEHVVPSGIVYLSRFYRLRDGFDFPTTSGPVAADLGYLKFAAFLGDNRTFSITFAVERDDAELRRLADPDRFERAARSLDAAAEWCDGRAEPITGVYVMAGLRNRRRFFADGTGTPLVHGFFAVGDAHIGTNPLYGRGCSLALVHAYALVDALAADDPERAFLAATDELVAPWFKAAVRQDAEARELSGPTDANDPKQFMREVFREGLLPAVRTSPVVYRAFLRWFNLESTPDALMQDGEVLAAVWATYEDRANRPPEPALGPSRAELLARL